MAITNPNLIAVLQEVTSSLNTHNVDYLIIGGTAVNFHGFTRPSGGLPTGVNFDIDIWYNPTTENYFKIAEAIKEMGVTGADRLDKVIFDPNTAYLRMINGNYRLEFLPKIQGYGLREFSKCYERRSNFLLNEVDVPVIARKDLFQNKRALDREVDREDILEIEKVVKKQKKDQGLSM